MIDLSPVVAKVEIGAIKVVIALFVSTLLYVIVFLSMKNRSGKRLAHLGGQFAGGMGALAAMYVAFVVLAR
jgi:hypothetical protein